jgi:beta-glucanase (GH16 family)
MKKIVLAFIFVCLISSFGLVAQAWSLVWHDEFNDTAINLQNWTFDTGTSGDGWGNNELENYTSRPQNAKVSNGNLLIIARKENFNGSRFTSTRMKTQYLKSWTYGKVEARIKLPFRQGLWPGFWMLGDTIDEIGFPFCGEIDIMEYINTDPTLHGTMHWADNNQLADYGGTTTIYHTNAYHTYSVEWDSNSIKWFVDDQQYWEGLISNNINQTNAFHHPFFILLNLAVGGGWPGNPDRTTHFPDTMFVDYVRVYQIKQGEKNK